MIVTEKKPFGEILKGIAAYTKVFLVGCGECATTCKTGGSAQVAELKGLLEAQGKIVTGTCLPNAPCVAAQIKMEFAKQMAALREAEAILVLACGLGVQSVKANDRLNLAAIPCCNTLFGAVVDSAGNLFEKCSLCGNCILESTEGICPNTLCAKGLLNGPCGGMNHGKCEADRERDCAWVLIYRALEKKNKLDELKKIHPPKDFKKAAKPHKVIMS